MAAYHQVYDSRRLQTDCQEPGSAPEPYARQSSVWTTFTFFYTDRSSRQTSHFKCSDFVDFRLILTCAKFILCQA